MSMGVNQRMRETPLGQITPDWQMGTVADYVQALEAGVSVNAVETDSGCLEGDIGVLNVDAEAIVSR